VKLYKKNKYNIKYKISQREIVKKKMKELIIVNNYIKFFKSYKQTEKKVIIIINLCSKNKDKKT
jgi:hypothetical protein